MSNDEAFLEKYERGLSGEGRQRNQYLKYVREYLEYAGGHHTKEAVQGYLDRLRRKKKYGDGSINFVFRVLRTFYSRNGIEWPFRRGEAPQIRENKVNAPALDPGIIQEMITAAKLTGTDEQRFFLGISSIYGLRREELMQLEGPDIDLRGGTIHIATLKHGRERSHAIPPEIEPVIRAYNFERVSETGLLVIWHSIEDLIGFEHVDRVGFHSIRRTLDTLLLDQLPETVVMSFLRWKQRTSTNMPYRYSAQRFIGREGAVTQVVGEAKDVDSKVFAVHPFLPYWREE